MKTHGMESCTWAEKKYLLALTFYELLKRRNAFELKLSWPV